ncbi:hypothetical protein KPH14_011439 [Odynerus spinipes]|uniref:F-box domain-containing protein n=1 Tax=Odynerus spinipes TaxID=1348599 RepID=A0AAD9VTV1_9HYME|nr:hypothetical protein KPH14_011439 [Odynerus spinipes]
MNSGMVEHTRLGQEDLPNSEEFSPPESKRMRLDDGCNNLNSTFNSTSKNSTRWSYTADSSLVEPEILEDMGVSMLDNETINCDNVKKLQSQDCTISPNNADNNKRLPLNDNGIYESESESLYRGSSFETINVERLEQDPFDIDNPCIYGISNESGYGSRVEVETYGDTKENFSKDKLNAAMDEDSSDNFYLYRRKRKLSVTGDDEFNKLSDEMILMIFRWLPKKCLVRCMLVCKRWCQIARDEALWSRLDLGSKVLNEGTLGHILPRGVQILRLAQAEIADPIFKDNNEVLCSNYACKLQYLDLSMAVISADGLAALLAKCKYLKKLSLESCTLNTSCSNAISWNTDITVLNLAMCEGLDFECVSNILKLRSLTALNVAWCSLDAESVSLLCKSLPPSVTRLNISGCRKTMTDDNVKDLVKSCPDMVELDLSDCTLLTMNTVPNLLNFSKLEHLSLSRCYSIPPSTYIRLAYMPCLLYLDVFGLMSEPMLKSVQANCGETEINKFLYSSVARPTVGVRRTSIWGLRVRD